VASEKAFQKRSSWAQILAVRAFLASRKINKLRVFNTSEYSAPPRLHHSLYSVHSFDECNAIHSLRDRGSARRVRSRFRCRNFHRHRRRQRQTARRLRQNRRPPATFAAPAPPDRLAAALLPPARSKHPASPKARQRQDDRNQRGRLRRTQVQRHKSRHSYIARPSHAIIQTNRALLCGTFTSR
jgi:hypothetical protein